MPVFEVDPEKAPGDHSMAGTPHTISEN